MHKIYAQLNNINSYNDQVRSFCEFIIDDYYFNDEYSYGVGFYGFVDGGGIGSEGTILNRDNTLTESKYCLIFCGKDDWEV